MKATFPKSERLCSKLEIEHLFANGTSNRFGDFTARFVRTHAGADVSSVPKILISVPKRYQKRSVDRNRTKRLIREVFRKNKTEYFSETNIQTLAIIYTSSKIPDYARVEDQLPKLLEKIRWKKSWFFHLFCWFASINTRFHRGSQTVAGLHPRVRNTASKPSKNTVFSKAFGSPWNEFCVAILGVGVVLTLCLKPSFPRRRKTQFDAVNPLAILKIFRIFAKLNNNKIKKLW